MKILIITNLYPPYERGGAELVVRKEARTLRDEGNEVFILTSTPFRGLSSLRPQGKVEDGIKVLRYFPLNVFWYKHDWKFLKGIRFLWHILDTLNVHSYFVTRGVLKKLNPDQVRTHNLKGVGLTTALALQKNMRREWTHFIHDVQLFEPSGLLYKKQTLGAGVYSAITRKLFGSPWQIEAPSRWVVQEHKSRGFFKDSADKIVRWYPPAAQILKENGNKNPRLMFVGQLAQHKGILFLAQVLCSLPSGYTLDVVGGGPLQKEVEGVFAGNPWVYFHGQVTQQEVRGLLKNADYLVVPSLASENCPTVIVDALVAGVPVIASRIGGIPEMITDGVNGYLVTAGDKKQWNQVLASLLTEG